ncbi:hypothetical protein SDC9_192481 [bioreactor metagenome]|uniref:Uncharacterized protein n=1 Tax=bioreactor metagenome TaxID=1076179 RepID=A0A645I9C3_9ZZZZ
MCSIRAYQAVVQRVTRSVEMKSIANCILRRCDVDPHVHHFANAGYAAGARFLIDPHDREHLRIGADVYVCLAQKLHDLDCMRLILIGDGGAVSTCYTAAPAFLQRQPCGVFQRPIKHIFRLIDVHIDQAVILFGDFKHEIHVLALELVQPFRSRHAARDIGAHLHRFPHEPFRSGVAEDALLRKGDNLQVADVLCLLFRG